MSDIQVDCKQQSTTNFSYETFSTISEELQLCLAIAINKDNTHLIASSYAFIKLFQFKKGITKFYKTIHDFKVILTLTYFNQKSNFISGSENGCLKIWSTSLIQSSKFLIKLCDYSSEINCLVLHPNEDLIICGSNCIEFWSCAPKFIQHQQWMKLQTISYSTTTYYGLSLNKSGNQLIACTTCRQILILEGSNIDQWQIVQKINLNFEGFRLSFISESMFAFQTTQNHTLSIYSNIKSGEYLKILELILKKGNDQFCYEYFPMQYIPCKNIILSKNGCHVYIIEINDQSKEQQNLKLKLSQTINFGTKSIFGTMSQNGEYLMIWDYDTNQIQIRKYTCKQ